MSAKFKFRDLPTSQGAVSECGARRTRNRIGTLCRFGCACAAIVVLPLLFGGCAEVAESFYSPHYPRGMEDVSDLDYCDSIARATLHAEGEISQDIGREFEGDHVSHGPDTLERNLAEYEERRRFQEIVAECLRQRRAAAGHGTSR
jgi:hypothetical protein